MSRRPAAEGGRAAMRYEPGLDGLRAVAVIVILMFHLGYGWAAGGFVTLPVFFTLSGYLITRLLLAEHARSGTIALSRFWTRRLRRLAPASLLTIAGVLLVARWIDPGVPTGQLRGDATAAAANVANWRFMLSDESYAELFVGRPSPLLHFWSLAVEEQFYFVFPVLVGALLWFAGRRRWVLPAAFVALIAASVAAAVATDDLDVVYYGTHTRAAELLVGSLAAVFVARRGLPTRRPGLVAANVAALAAAALLVVTTLTVRQGDAWLYNGGFALLSVGWVGLVVGALVPGPLRAALSVRPLVAVGKMSYGIYLFHWPVLMFLDERWITTGWLLDAVRVVAVIGLAVASYVIVEQPVRQGRLPRPGWPSRLAYPLAIGAVVLLVVSTTGTTPRARTATSTMLEAPTGAAAVVIPPPVETAPSTTEPPAVRIEVVGGDGVVADALLRLDGVTVGARRVEVRDATTRGCTSVIDPQVTAVDACPLPEQRRGTATDLVVLAVGAAEQQVLELGGTRTVPIGNEMNLRYRGVERDFAGRTMRLGATVPLAVAPAGVPAGGLDLVQPIVASAVASTPGAHVVDPASVTAAELLALLPDETPRLKVMVVGDSVSYGMAVQLGAVAGDRLLVVWAGGQNCPLVDVSELRWWEGAQWTMEECPNVGVRWPETIASFRPDVVFAVASLPEQSEQRYGDDPQWYVAGDPAYTAAHDEMINGLLDLVAPSGAVVVAANAPPITDGLFSESTMADPNRVASWNSQLLSWAAQHPDVVAVLDLAAMVTDAEAAAGGSLRVDGVHLADDALAGIIDDRLADELIATVARLRAAGAVPAR